MLTFLFAFISSSLGYCNALLRGLSKVNVKSLQAVQNAAVYLKTITGKFEHITAFILHWLPLQGRIAINVIAPSSLTKVLYTYIPGWNLRSQGTALLAYLKVLKQILLEGCLFAPTLWNSLPLHIR